MPFSRRLLANDEDVMFDSHPHWIWLVRPFGIAAFIFGGCIAIFVVWSTAPTWVGISLGIVGVAIFAYVASKFIRWRTTRFIVTSHRVIARVGVLRRVGKEIPIDRVQDVTYHQGLGERIVGAGTILIESAGEKGAETFTDVRHPDELQTLINRAHSASRTRASRPLPAVEERKSIVTEIDELDELRRRGILTETEFEEKKSALLRDL